MGCDIHLFVERRRKATKDWVPVDPPQTADTLRGLGYYLQFKVSNDLHEIAQAMESDPYPAVATKWNIGRNYDAFARLSDVRNGYNIERMSLFDGHPDDLSTAIEEYFYDDHGEIYADYHSETWGYASRLEDEVTSDDPECLRVLVSALKHVANTYGIRMHDLRVVLAYDN